MSWTHTGFRCDYCDDWIESTKFVAIDTSHTTSIICLRCKNKFAGEITKIVDSYEYEVPKYSDVS